MSSLLRRVHYTVLGAATVLLIAATGVHSGLFNTYLQNDLNGQDDASARHYILRLGGIDAPRNGMIFVDAANGHDSGTYIGLRGSTMPVATLSKAIALAHDGDVIELAPGTPYTAGAVINKAVTIHGNGAIISVAGGVSHVLDVQADKVKIDNLEINGNGTPMAGEYGNGLIRVGAANVTLRNLYLHDSTENGIEPTAPNAHELSIIGCRIERTKLGIYSTGTLAGDLGNVEIADCFIKDVADRAIRFTGWKGHPGQPYSWRGLNIHHNFITYATLTDYTLGVEIWGGAADVMVNDNYVYGAQFGISSTYIVNGTVSNNTVKGCGYAAVEVATSLGPMSIVGNSIDGRNLAGTAITKHGVVVSNYYTVYGDAGNFTIASNTITNCGTDLSDPESWSIAAHDSHHVNIVGNTINTTGGGIKLLNDDSVICSDNLVDSGAVDGIGVLASGRGPCKSWEILNNTIWGANQHALHILNGGDTPNVAVRVFGNHTLTGAVYLNMGNGGIIRVDGAFNDFQQGNNYPESSDDTKGWTPLTIARLTFTPTNIGWYRVISSGNEIEGQLHISDSTTTTRTDYTVQFAEAAYAGNQIITQLGGGIASNYLPVSVSKARVGKNSSGATAFDIYVATVPTGPISLYLEVSNAAPGSTRALGEQGLQGSPALNPSTSGWTLATLTLNQSAGLATNGLLIGVLPTNCTNVPSGAAYNNGGTVAVCP